MGRKEKLRTLAKEICKKQLLSNWTLLIITTTIDPWIDDMVATCGRTSHMLAMPMTKEVIMGTERSSARVIQTPGNVIIMGRGGTNPGN